MLPPVLSLGAAGLEAIGRGVLGWGDFLKPEAGKSLGLEVPDSKSPEAEVAK